MLPSDSSVSAVQGPCGPNPPWYYREGGPRPDSAHHGTWPSAPPDSQGSQEPRLLCSVWLHVFVSVALVASVLASPPPLSAVTYSFSCLAQSLQSRDCSFPGVSFPYLPGSRWPWPRGTELVNSLSSHPLYFQRTISSRASRAAQG